MAQDIHLWGWDVDAQDWVKCLVDETGKLIIDPTDIFEAAPTENEHGKAPDSAWAFDHKKSPTVHQDAPNLIEAHRLTANAHHSKYTDAEVRALFSPISVPAPAFTVTRDTYQWTLNDSYLQNRVLISSQYYYAPLYFPNGVTVTKLTLYGYRDDPSSSLRLRLRRIDRIGGASDMALVISNWVDGVNNQETATITNPTIDNVNYAYGLRMEIHPNDYCLDCYFYSAVIDFTG